MFHFLGRLVTHAWPYILAFWGAAFLVARFTPPAWSTVAVDGELQHLPDDMPTRVGARIYDRAFPDDITDSNMVVVLHRTESKLGPEDREFIRGPLLQGLMQVAAHHGGVLRTQPLQALLPHELKSLVEFFASHGVPLPESLKPLACPPGVDHAMADEAPRVVSIESLQDAGLGSLLVSDDNRATLVVVGLTSGFLETRNERILSDIEALVARLRHEGLVPPGLRIDLSGSATVGTSTIRAVTKSTRAVRRWAIWITVVMLFVVFRAPLGALVPLVAMYVAVEITLATLAWAAYYELLSVFDGLTLYITVIVFGAGVDYSLFLLARQEEELRAGLSTSEGVSRSLQSVGTAIAASAGTEIIGVGLLATANFGKFQQAAVGISLGLFILLVASLTLTPSILCLTRRWTFWPQPLSRERAMKRLSLDWISHRIWRTLADAQRKYPGTILIAATALLAPMAGIGIIHLDRLSYGLLAGLPADTPSVRGIEVVGKHFQPGVTGPITLLLHNDRFDFSSREGVRQIAELSARLLRRGEQLKITDIRSVSAPLGSGQRAQQIARQLAGYLPFKTFLDQGRLVVADTTGLPLPEVLLQETIRSFSFEHYVSHSSEYDGTVTRMTLIPRTDPYRSESIQQMDQLQQTLSELLPDELAGTKMYLLGATASLRDIRDVARSDWRRIRVVIPIGVLLVLVLLLRRPVVSTYLVLTVIFSFLVTFGVTHSLFRAYSDSTFEGVDWTVPVLLFTLLMAVGEDYSVLLVSRTEEERQEHAPTRGVSEALVKTGGLISGAGLIMAGTFSALVFGGTPAGMQQLGFALSFGILLDTFVVRPLLVPSFLDLSARWRLRRAMVRYHRSSLAVRQTNKSVSEVVRLAQGMVMKSCHCCGLVQQVPPVPRHGTAVCLRCRTRLRIRSSERPSNILSAAISLAGLIVFLPAITLPFLVIEQLGHRQQNSLIGGIVSLFRDGYWLVALMILVFYVVLPPVKLFALLVLGTIPDSLRGGLRAGAFRAVEQLGRWSMLDVLLLAVVLAFIKLGDLVEIGAGPGAYAFGLFVLLSLLGAYFFDSHALWDEGPMVHENTFDDQEKTTHALTTETRSDTDSARPEQPDQEAQTSPAAESGEQRGHSRGAASESRGETAETRQVELPTARIASRWRSGWVWLLPLLAAAVVGFLLYQEWQQQGVTISITFSEGHGLKTGDKLKYRGTVVGEVREVSLSDALDAVRAKVQLKQGTESLAREGSRFWVVRPQLNLTRVTGLETVVGANYLAVLPGPAQGEPQFHFVGLEQPPLQDIQETGGLNLVLKAADASGLMSGSPVYYRQIRVGGVRSVALASDASAVDVRVYIRPAFRQLVLPNAKFWKTSGVQFEAGWSGVTLKMGAAQTLLETGIAMAVPMDADQPVEPGHRFVLHEQPQDDWLAWRPALGAGTVPEQLPQPTWALLEWTETGYLYNTSRKRQGYVLASEEFLIAPQDLLLEPDSAAPHSAHLLLGGRRLQVGTNIESVGESLGRMKVELDEQQAFPVELREAQEPEDLLIVGDPNDGPIYVAASRLTREADHWLIDQGMPAAGSWHGAVAVALADGAVVGLLLDEMPARVALYRQPANTEGNGSES